MMQIVLHTCSNCGQEKEIYLKPDERKEDLEGCVCDRTVSNKHHELKFMNQPN